MAASTNKPHWDSLAAVQPDIELSKYKASRAGGGDSSNRILSLVKCLANLAKECATELATEENGLVTTKYPPKKLNIIWGNDSRYWRLPTDNNGRPAELIQVCWLEVTGTFDGVQGKKYEIGFEISLTPDAFGWNGCHVYVMAKVGKRGKYSWKRSSLENPKSGNFQIPLETLEIKVDDNASNTDSKIYFGMYEVWSGKWKGGLKINNAIIKEVPATPPATSSS